MGVAGDGGDGNGDREGRGCDQRGGDDGVVRVGRREVVHVRVVVLLGRSVRSKGWWWHGARSLGCWRVRLGLLRHGGNGGGSQDAVVCRVVHRVDCSGR